MKKTILVFGASGYIGKRFCHLYQEKYDIISVGGKSSGPWIKFDFLNPDFERLHLHLSRDSCSIDGILFLQGMNPNVGIDDVDLQHFNEMLQMNVSVPSLIIRELFDKINDGSTITFISSVAAKKGSYDPAYAAAKSAIAGTINSLSNKWGHLRFNSVALGLVEDSPVHEGMTADFEKKHRDAMGGRLVKVNDVCKTLDFLLECESIACTEIQLDCGYKL